MDKAHEHKLSLPESSKEAQMKLKESQSREYPSYIRRLTSSLPPFHRPTKDEMLALATGFWDRLKIRFKWFTIRGFRKFNTDDISAFLSWFVVSQAVWIMLGT
jgi:distribution and morphology protein 31